MALQDITNFEQLTPQYGTAGQPTREQFNDIANAGFQAVINLALPSSDHALSDEGSIVTSLGMAYCHLPVDFAAPTAHHAYVFNGLLKSWGDQPVFIHCVMNLRVSAFMYHYLRMEQGCDDSSARTQILGRWEPKMDEAWLAFMRLTPTQVAAARTTP